MARRSRLLGCLLAVILAPVQAGSVGLTAPIPLLNGDTKGKLIYSMSGLRSSTSDILDYAVVVTCTSTLPATGKPIVLGVEFFQAGGGAVNSLVAGQGVVVLEPGRTVSISSVDTSLYNEDETTGDTLSMGAARIIATSNKVLCAAFQVETDNFPPLHMWSIPVHKKTKQKGE